MWLSVPGPRHRTPWDFARMEDVPIPFGTQKNPKKKKWDAPKKSASAIGPSEKDRGGFVETLFFGKVWNWISIGQQFWDPMIPTGKEFLEKTLIFSRSEVSGNSNKTLMIDIPLNPGWLIEILGFSWPVWIPISLGFLVSSPPLKRKQITRAPTGAQVVDGNKMISTELVLLVVFRVLKISDLLEGGPQMVMYHGRSSKKPHQHKRYASKLAYQLPSTIFNKDWPWVQFHGNLGVFYKGLYTTIASG